VRSADERPRAHGGDGPGARPLASAGTGGFVERHGLWDERQHVAAGHFRRVIDELGLDKVRFSFADQHGVLRGKTLTREAVPGALRSGVTAPSSLLLKDTSGRTVFPVFSGGGGLADGRFAGAGDIVLVPDMTTFRVLPWAERTGWILCDLYHPDGTPAAFCSRGLLRGRLAALADAGYDLTVGVELEFHVYRPAADGSVPVAPGRPGAPGPAPEVEPLSSGSQLLHEEGLDRLDDLVDLLYRGLTGLDLPLRSLELEFGPSQLELTLDARDAAQAADDALLARAAVRQICRRNGYHATFMSRPATAETASSGWHLHQSLRSRATGEAAFDPAPGPALGARSGARSGVRLGARLGVRLCVGGAAVPDGAVVPGGPALPRRAAGTRARRHGLHHADRQRLQAVPADVPGSRPGGVGHRQQGRHGAGRRCPG
jgi:glutamine synthetase